MVSSIENHISTDGTLTRSNTPGRVDMVWFDGVYGLSTLLGQLISDLVCTYTINVYDF